MVALALLAYCSSSYSEDTVYGQGNAFGLNWVMTQVLPQQAGLTVNGVIYSYETVKQTEDAMLVHVQNENALGEGYIFRETDDWTGLPSNRINKLVATGSIPIEYWGNGSIEVEGKGEVKDASVIYNYSYEPCFDPQSSPECPGYRDPNLLVNTDTGYEDPMEDPFIKEELERKADLEDEDQEEAERKAMATKVRERLQVALGAVNTALMEADAAAKEAEFMAMATLPTTYLNTTISGGTYNDVPPPYEDKQLPQNASGRRMGFAQQKLHDEMVQSQYGENE